MQKKDKKKYTVDFDQQHPCTKFLNVVYKTILKPIIKEDITDIYGLFEAQHIAGKKERSPYTYLTLSEVHQVILDNCRESIKVKVIDTIKNHPFEFTLPEIALAWRQYQQVYYFSNLLLDDLTDVDMEDPKSFCLTPEELQFLPCPCFYIQYPVKLNDTNYHGFFVYFDSHSDLDDENQIHIRFITDFVGQKKNPYLGVPDVVDCFDITLQYAHEQDYYTIFSKSTGEITTTTIKPLDMMKAKNPNTFKVLGEEGAIKLFTTVCQMISYLAASNADITVTKKRKKKLDLKHTNAVSEEIEVRGVGEQYAKIIRKANESDKEIVRPIPPFNVRSKDVLPKGAELFMVDDLIELGELGAEEEKPDDDRPERGHYHVRPHMRRAHWAWYWYGKRDGSEERVKRRKFISAVFINAANNDDFVTPTIEVIRYF